MNTDGPYVIVPCSSRKSRFGGRAIDVYQGSLFRLAVNTADAITAPWKIGILSAKHGFLRLHDRIEPYDCTWTSPDAATDETLVATSDRIRERLHRMSPVEQEPVVLLLPKAYAERALRVWPDAQWPLAGCAGIGDMRRRLARLRDGRDHLTQIGDTA